jgi:hypothetical protein
MFTSLPKLADKTFVIAFLVPTLAFLLALNWAFPGLLALHEPSEHADAGKALADAAATLLDATVSVAALWFFALALMMVNRPLYRLLEGYFGPLAAKAAVGRQQHAWDLRRREIDQAEATARALRPGAARDDAARSFNQLRLRFGKQFPPTRARVLGSRFGNVNRAFEDYSEQAYGVFGVTTWPRLSAVIPASFQSVLTDARAQVDCFVNVTFLALAFGAVEIGRWFWDGAAAVARDWPHAGVDFWLAVREAAAHANWPALLAALVAVFVVRRVAYELALNRAQALGEQVRAAFDLYLGGLAKQLGYDLPPAEQDRRALWRRLRRTWAYGDPPPELFRAKRPPDPPPPDSGGGKADGDEAAGDGAAGE